MGSPRWAVVGYRPLPVTEMVRTLCLLVYTGGTLAL